MRPKPQETRIRILLSNQQPIIRNGLRSLLEHEPDFAVVAEAANGQEALVLADYKQPDVMLIDIKLPFVNGIEVARQVSTGTDAPRMIFVSEHTDRSYVTEAFKAGARGYVDGDAAPIDLSRAIRVVVRGGVFLSPTISSQLLEVHVVNGKVSEYDRTLWCLIASGHNEAEIAKILRTDEEHIRLETHSPKSLLCRNTLPGALATLRFA